MRQDVETEFEVDLVFDILGTFLPGRPAIMPSFRDEVGDPGYGPEIEFCELKRVGVSVREDGKWVTKWLNLTTYQLNTIREIIEANSELLSRASDAIENEVLY